MLLDALLKTASRAEIEEINAQLGQLVSKRALQRTAGWGLRGEVLFAVPCMLTKNPRLLGYYRLLLGFSQKQFYGATTGFASFRAMEDKAQLGEKARAFLPELCKALCASAEQLVKGVDSLTNSNVHELTLLTLGPQLRGGALNLFGAKATEAVFELIKTIVAPAMLKADSRSIEARNAAGRVVAIEFLSDPDICIREGLASGRYRNLVAIEIKGGKDISNIHNRLGEAEKSHQKARKQGFVECWTIVGVGKLDLEIAKKESPSTDRFYRIQLITKPTSEEFRDFKENLLSRVGLGDQLPV